MTKKAIELNEAGEPTGRITFTFDDGSTQTFDVSQTPEAIRARLALHGAAQKIGDSYAGASSSDNPLEYAKAAVRDTIAQLYRGEWSMRTGGGTRVSDLALALSRLTGKTTDETQAFVETLDDEGKKAWRGKAQVKAMLATIAAERAAARAAKLAQAAGNGEGKEEEAIVLE